MECLPEEMVLLISGQLTVQDLAACCAVSHAWRDLFNRDVFWRQRFDAALAVHLRDTMCVVEPCFESPEVEGSGLSSVCECRLSCMRQAHLHNNWALGRYRTFRIENTELRVVFSSVSYDNNESLVVMYCQYRKRTKHYREKIQIWDITSNPSLISECDVGNSPRPLYKCYSDEFYVHGGQVILKSDNFVQIFSIENLELKLRCAFCIADSDILPDLSELKYTMFGEVKKLFRGVLLGPVYLAIQQEPTRGRQLHVWNVETGKKLKEEVYHDFVFFKIYGDKSCNNKEAIIAVDQPSKTMSKIVIYNTSHLAFINFSLVYNDIHRILNCVRHRDCITINTGDCLKTYSLATNQLVYSIPHSGDRRLYTLGDNYVFCDHGKLKLFNLNSLGVKQLLNDTVTMFEVLFKKFIVLWFSEKCNNDETDHYDKTFIVCSEQCKINVTEKVWYIPYRSWNFNTNIFGTKILFYKHINAVSYVVLNYW